MSDQDDVPADIQQTWDLTLAPDPALVPARLAVIAVRDRNQRTFLVAATADARRFLGDRLGDDPRRAQIGDIASTISLAFVGSALEADLVCLRVARAAAPDQHRAMVDKLRTWFIRFDPEEPTPTWTKTNLGDVVGQPAHRFIGPFADKSAAGRYAETLDELFDLCRYPRELAKAPKGAACAYKEMGKCPAACDGSEPMHDYTARVRRAIALSAEPVEHTVEELDDQMRLHAAHRDFERAEKLKKRIELLTASTRPTSKHRTTLDAFARLIVAPSPRRNWARVFRCDAQGVRVLCDLPGKNAKDAAQQLDTQKPAADAAISQQAAEELGIACAHLYAPLKKRVRFVDIGPYAHGRADEITRAIRAATSQAEPDDITERVIETG